MHRPGRSSGPSLCGGTYLSDRARERIASRFRALGEPTRLRILERLFRAPASVGEVLDFVGGTQANVSKHLALLHAGGLVSRTKVGLRTVYAIADPTLEHICEIVCGAVSDEAHTAVREIHAANPAAARKTNAR